MGKSKYFNQGYFSVEVNGVLYSNPFTNVKRNLEIIGKIRGAERQNAEIDRFLAEKAEWEKKANSLKKEVNTCI